MHKYMVHLRLFPIPSSILQSNIRLRTAQQGASYRTQKSSVTFPIAPHMAVFKSFWPLQEAAWDETWGDKLLEVHCEFRDLQRLPFPISPGISGASPQVLGVLV